MVSWIARSPAPVSCRAARGARRAPSQSPVVMMTTVPRILKHTDIVTCDKRLAAFA
jgi:hypothetical protein